MNQPATQPSPLLSVAEVARRLSLSDRAVRTRIANGELPAIRLGDGPSAPVRISEDALDAYVTSRDQLAKTRARANLLGPVLGLFKKERVLRKLETPTAGEAK